MANERNKILPYALSAIEGVNIQSQEDYSASSETTGGVSTGLANGNNFNKLAKQVSIMSSSLAEFIVNTLSEQIISDTNSIEEISSALNSAILKLIKDNEPVIPDKSGINVINNTSSIIDFNEIIETGIYYIFKDLKNKPIYSNKNFGILIVLNTENTVKQFFSFFEEDVPSQINSNYCSREKTGVGFSSWNLVYGISFKNNEIIIDEFSSTSSATFPIFELINNKKQIKNATRSQMREKLGIADQPDLTDYFNKTTDKLNLATQVTGQLKNANIADNAITTSKIASLAITADKLASSSVTNAKIADNAITTSKIASLAITADKLASSSVTNAKIANGAVTSEKIASKTITASNIADNTITSQQIAENAITASELANNAVDNAAIANGAVTDAKFSGTLSVSHGGHGTTDGFGWKNAYLDTEFNAKIGLSYPFTTQELVSAIINTITQYPVFCMVAGWRKSENSITDFPGSDLTHRTIINMSDLNQFYLETVDPFNLTTYICNVSNGIAGPWIKTRNADGSIPVDLIPPTVLTYTNDQGTWTETKLSDGTTMLEGWGMFSIDNLEPGVTKLQTISYPKNVKSGSVYPNISWSVFGTEQRYTTLKTYNVNLYINRLEIRLLDTNTVVFPLNSIYWYIKGILA